VTENLVRFGPVVPFNFQQSFVGCWQLRSATDPPCPLGRIPWDGAAIAHGSSPLSRVCCATAAWRPWSALGWHCTGVAAFMQHQHCSWRR
jgi:hypothetical protein